MADKEEIKGKKAPKKSGSSNSGRFSKDNPAKPRGKAFKTKFLETCRKESLLGLRKNASREATEEAFLSHVAKRAFDIEDNASGALLKELLGKSYGSIKATLPEVEFEFDSGLTPSEQVNQILQAASEGNIPPDVAALFIGAIKAASDVEFTTSVKARLEEVERLLGVSS